MRSKLDMVYALMDEGHRVFPVALGPFAAGTMKRNKKPALRDWQSWATTSRETLDGWVSGHGDDWFTVANDGSGNGLGLATGNGLLIVDIDSNDPDLLERIYRDYGIDLRFTRTHRTPRGGWHVWYELPSGVVVRNNQSGMLGADVDLRGEGGFIVIPPSDGYEFTSFWNGVDLMRYRDVAPIPRLLLDAILEYQEERKPKPIPELPKRPDNLPVFDPYRGSRVTGGESHRPGDDYNKKVSCEVVFEAHGWQRHSETSEAIHFTRPGKERSQGISASVWKDNGRATIYTTTGGYETGGWLTPFSLLANLHFNNDYSATTSYLRSSGYGGGESGLARPRTDGGSAEGGGDAELDDEIDEWAGWAPFDWAELGDDSIPTPLILQIESLKENSLGGVDTEADEVLESKLP